MKKVSVFLLMIICFIVGSCLGESDGGVLEKKHFVVIIPSYNNNKMSSDPQYDTKIFNTKKPWWQSNLDSALSQVYPNFEIVYMDDASSDGTGNFVEAYLKEHIHKSQAKKVTLIKNDQNVGTMANIYKAVHMSADNSIIVSLDGDDAFKHDDVLSILNETYQDPDVWLTFGSLECWPAGASDYSAPIPVNVIKNNSYRLHAWSTSALRTFYAWLFKKINYEDLIYEGSFFEATHDMAIMFPMLEMSGGRFKFISDVLYVYNIVNPINDYRVKLALQAKLEKFIRNKPAYKPLADLVFRSDVS